MKFITSAILLVAISPNVGNAQVEPQRPNIVYLLADDLGYGDLGCYGQDKFATPHIDTLARQGLRFTQHYAGSTVCAPSRSVLMTGQHTGHTTVRNNTCQVGGTAERKGDRVIRRMNLTAEDVTVAHVLKDAGYRTCVIGKWHLGGYHPEAGPLNRGFDEFYGTLIRTSHGRGNWPERWWRNDELVEIPANARQAEGRYRTDIITDEAVGFMERNRERPFFLYVAYRIVHSPYVVDDLGPYADEAWSDKEKTYAAMIHRLDQSVGRLMKTLRDLGLDEDTIVFFTSDNGPRSEAKPMQTDVVNFFNSNGPLRGYKRDLTDGGIRVPMIVRWPGVVPAGRTSKAVWYFADILPTAAELAGARPPANVDGVSVVGALTDPNSEIPERLL
jgi:arylsulfatase A-like enzyme